MTMTSITRRSFVAAAAGAIAVPGVSAVTDVPSRLAGGNVPLKQLPLTDRDFYYLHSDPDGRQLSVISGSRENPRHPRLTAVRRRFQPLPTHERFRAVCVDWEGFPVESQPPSSLLQLPAMEGKYAESTAELSPFVSRQRGLQIVAAYNRNEIEVAEESETELDDWCVLIEYGQPEQSVSYLAIDFAANGVGCDHGWPMHPVRVVVPTAEELARYALSEGGA